MKIFHKEKSDLKAAVMNLVRNLPITIEYMAAATLVSTVFFYFSTNVTNISIIYTLAIILIARATSCYGAGILASLFGVFWVNFAFTYPYMTLNFTMSGYPITFVGMMLISCLASSICIMITKQNVQLQEKDRMLLDAEKETMKANLMRAMSHDLRTPLTTIIGSSSTYLNQEGSMTREEKRKLVQNIEEDAQWLLTMVENLLNLTRIQEGRLDINKKKEVVDDLVASAVRLVSNRVGNHTLKMETPEDILLVSVDGRLFIQVLVNLLDNAFRHSGTGTTVTLRVKQDGNCLKFVVSDNGIGIPNDKIDKIFDNFFTTAYENGDKQRGVGLGLTICKAMVEAQGGTIRAFNSPQGGAVFEVSMPMEDRKDE